MYQSHINRKHCLQVSAVIDNYLISDESDNDLTEDYSNDEIPESTISSTGVSESEPKPVKANSESGARTKTVETEDGKRMFQCPFCSYMSKFPSNVARHKRAQHSNKAVCSFCQMLFNTREDLVKHRQERHSSRDFLCDICLKAFTSRKRLRSHHQNKHETNKKFKCGMCDKSFTVKAHFLGHLNSHSDTKPHECEHCQKSFSYISSYQRHVKVCKGAEGDREVPVYKCPECSRVLKNAQNLKEHLSCRHGDMVHRCKCGKSFRWRASLFNHKTKCPCRWTSELHWMLS